jgi:hypothetical protein
MAPAHSRHSHRIEIVIGRSAAICAHPFAAWYSRSWKDRAVLLISYFTIGYVVVLGLLHAILA